MAKYIVIPLSFFWIIFTKFVQLKKLNKKRFRL